MKRVHLVVCDLFLPADIASEVCADLRLPALERMLARGGRTGLSGTEVLAMPLENHLCGLFGVPCLPDAPIAPISAAFDGLGGGCWLRADPVNLRMQQDQLVLAQGMAISAEEAGQLCSALNDYFAGQGMEFFAPHPLRWYVRLERLPDIETVPLSLAAGRNVRGLLPAGMEAAHWHRVFNEIQMLLFAHPVNQAREARGELPVNTVWFWGGGCDSLLAKPADSGTNATIQRDYDSVISDDELAAMFAAAAGIRFMELAGQWCDNGNRQLLVWTGLRRALQQGDLGAWRSALQDFEEGYAQPLWRALRSGKISQVRLDISGGDRIRCFALSRADTWAFWRRTRPLADYSMM